MTQFGRAPDSAARVGKRSVQSMAVAREDGHLPADLVDLHPVASNLTSCSQASPFGGPSRWVGSKGGMKTEGRIRQ